MIIMVIMIIMIIVMMIIIIWAQIGPMGPKGPHGPRGKKFWSMHVPKCYYLQHSGACMSQNDTIYSILEHACPQMLLFTSNNPFLELISGFRGFRGFRGNGVSSRRTDPP